MSAPRLEAPDVPVGAMYRALVGIGLLCGLVIVSVYQGTKPTIDRKKAEALQRAVFEVVPGAATSAAFRWVDGRFERLAEGASAAPGEAVVYGAWNAAGELAGVAIEARGMGYQDTIVVLYGYAPARDGIVGIRVLESKETPGLGDKIEIDPAFQANFERLDVTLDPSGEALANPIRTVKNGEKRNPWEIDGITGATISSQAIGKLLDQSAALWVPRIAARRADFEGGESAR